MTSKDNGKSDGFEEVDGNPTTRRARKVAEAFAPGKRPEQQHLPGQEPKKIGPVHAAIEEYVEARDNRMELTKIEVEKKSVLLAAMKKAGIESYAVDGHEATLDVEETVKAKLHEEEEEVEPEVRASRKSRGRGAEVRA